MTNMIAPAPTPAPAASSHVPKSSTVDREPSFGPALADAQEHATTSSDTAHDARPRSASAQGAEHDGERSQNDDRSGTGDRADPSTDDTAARAAEADTASSGHTSDGAEASFEASNTTDDRDTAAAMLTGPVVIPASTDHAAPTGLLAVAHAAPVHPTAKGEVGDGGLSTTPTVESAASLDTSLRPTAPREAVTSQDAEAAKGVTAANAAPASDSSLTLPLVESTVATAKQHETTEPVGQGAADSGLSADRLPSVAPSAARVPGSAVADSASLMTGPGADGVPADLGRGQAATPSVTAPIDDGSLALVDDNSILPAGGEPVRGEAPTPAPVTQGDEGARPAMPTTTVARADGTETLVAPRGDIGRTVDVSSPGAPTAPTPGPLTSPEGSLWDDVRMAFDRIRTDGEGQEVRIRLRPAELGELVVQVRTQGDHVSVRLTASSTAAQQALVDDRLRLAAELARAGFGEGSVDIGQHDSGNLGDPQGDADRGRGRTIPETVENVGGRSDFERRAPIRTDSIFRPGRHAHSTINLTL